MRHSRAPLVRRQVKLAGNKGLAKEVKADLSRTHFTLGNDKFDWQTDAMRTQVRIAPPPCRKAKVFWAVVIGRCASGIILRHSCSFNYRVHKESAVSLVS